MGVAHVAKECLQRWWRVRNFSPITRSTRLVVDANRIYLAVKLFGKKDGGSDRFLDYEVKHPSRGFFVFLIDEIFISNDYYLDLGKPDPVILDCGSNIGMSILYFKTLFPQARITGFEPHPKIYQFLRKNLDDNAFADVTTHNIALAEKEGQLDFFFDEESDSGGVRTSLFADRGGSQKSTVRAGQLSVYVTAAVDLIKMDIEGAELQVLRELRDSGKMALVKNMLIEVHHKADPLSEPLGEIHDLLRTAGFSLQFECGRGYPKPVGTRKGQAQDVLIFAYRDSE